jgi:hypothetical protein
LTTLAAASLLFACGFLFFFQFGAFIFTVILLSIVMSLTFLIPLLIRIGPEREQGKILVPWRNTKNGHGEIVIEERRSSKRANPQKHLSALLNGAEFDKRMTDKE